MSTQAASTRPTNRPAEEVRARAVQEAPERMAMQEAPTRPMPMAYDGRREHMQAPGTETKQSFLTTEFWVYVIAVAGVIIAAFWPGPATNGLNINNPTMAWWFLTVLTGGYLLSRGLSKAGSARRSAEERRARH